MALNNKLTVYDYLVKVIMIGNSGVGKSSLMLQFTDNKFSDQFISTIGVDFKITSLEIHNKIVKIQIWDTAGQERFRTITQSYYRGANVIFLVFDLTNSRSFDCLAKWNDEINSHSNKDIIKILVGNKKDMIDEKKISWNEARLFADKNNFMGYFETSAMDLEGLERLFIFMCKEFIKKNENDKIVGKHISNETKKIFKLDEKIFKIKNDKNKCC